MKYEHVTLEEDGGPAVSPTNARNSRAAILETSERRARAIRVGAYMTAPVAVIHKNTPVLDAYNQMIQRGIRRLPVVDDGRLVGIVTLGDLREARPSPATSLSIYELNYLLSKLTVDRVMTHTPFTVTEATPLQDAAALMLAHKIGGLPVVDPEGRPIGIITESDFFRLFLTHWEILTGEPGPASDPSEVYTSDLPPLSSDV